MSDKEWKKNISSTNIWIRAVFMILFLIVASIVRVLVGFIALFQFIYRVIVGKPNHKLLNFTSGLASYVHQIILFVSFNTETKPYPFSEWGFVDSDKLDPAKKD